MTADVTIVVPTYNRPHWLDVSLRSILASASTVRQKTRILVVDDGSPLHEENRRVAECLGADYMLCPRNRGYAPTVVAGLAEVDSPYQALFGDDDFMLPNWFPLHLEAIEQGYDVVASWYRIADSNLVSRYVRQLQPVTFDDLQAGRNTVNDGALVRRSALDGLRWKPEMESVMMLTMWLALAFWEKRFYTIEEPTFLYRRHSKNLSSTHGERNADQRRRATGAYA